MKLAKNYQYNRREMLQDWADIVDGWKSVGVEAQPEQ